MREHYHNELRKFFRGKLLSTRGDLNLTQEKMAELLEISIRNYAELESGHNCCNALTLVLFLIYCYPDAEQFLKELKAIYEAEGKEAPTPNI